MEGANFFFSFLVCGPYLSVLRVYIWHVTGIYFTPLGYLFGTKIVFIKSRSLHSSSLVHKALEFMSYVIRKEKKKSIKTKPHKMLFAKKKTWELLNNF